MIGRHARPAPPRLLLIAGAVSAVTAAVLAAVSSDPKLLRLAVVLALLAVLPPAFAYARTPRGADLRQLRREVAQLRSDLAVRPTAAVEVVVLHEQQPALGRPTSVNGSAYLDRADGRRLVLDLVALEEAAATTR